MGISEFITKKTRASIAWFGVIIISIGLIIAAIAKDWPTVQFLSTTIAGIVLGYAGSQAYTKGEFIKKVGEAKTEDINKVIEP